MKSGNFKEVVFLGPDPQGKGGIATVLAQYGQVMAPFRRGSVNSSKGKIRSMLNLGVTMLKLLGYRMSGSRLLHIHYASGKSWIRETFLARCGRLLGYQTVMHCHCNLNRLAERHGSTETKKKLSQAAANIVLAQGYKAFAEKELGLDNVVIIPNFVDGALADAPVRHEGPTTFLYLGLLNEFKGFFDLLAACAALVREGKRFRLIVGGVGNEERVREFISKNGLADSVELRGWIGGQEKEKAFREADVLVLPSYSEGMPMVIIEALQRGIAVIGTEVGAVPDMVEKGVNGAVISPGDVEALSVAMNEMIEMPEKRDAYRQAALQKGREYTSSHVLPRLQQLYQGILHVPTPAAQRTLKS